MESYADLCWMYFKSVVRTNPATGILTGYYRLVESYRNMNDRVCHQTLLNIGFTDLTPEQMVEIQKQLNDRAAGQQSLFECEDPVVQEQVEHLWNELLKSKKVDTPEQARKKRFNYIEADSMQHRDVREMGGEWLCYQAIKELGIDQYLETCGWEEDQINLAITQLISRAVYPYSELRTSRWIKDNSAVCEITGYPIDRINKDRLYAGAHRLYGIKDGLENFLSVKTNELFDIDDKIVLYDLTNTYFEGRKVGSQIAKFGRSKEKRNDAKIVVLAMVTNMYGFVKYSSIFEGNMADSKSLEQIIDELRINTSDSASRATVVIDAGIASEENLTMLEKKGYDYVCVSRAKAKTVEAKANEKVIEVETKNKQKITIERVVSEKHTDYFLKVTSPAKKLKEQSMKNAFEQRFEEGLERLKARLPKKHAVKKEDKIQRSIGRLQQKYPSVSKYYSIDVESDSNGIVTSIEYRKNPLNQADGQSEDGVYFLRTNKDVQEETIVWAIYNLIREIESTFRCLKTDLDLRPIYHKTDEASVAHLHLGVLAYTVVNTIRQKLKPKGIKHSWTEIRRIANTQKMVTTRGQNMADQIIEVRKSSVPKPDFQNILDNLGYKKYPFVKKSVVHKIEHLPPESRKIPKSSSA